MRLSAVSFQIKWLIWSLSLFSDIFCVALRNYLPSCKYSLWCWSTLFCLCIYFCTYLCPFCCVLLICCVHMLHISRPCDSCLSCCQESLALNWEPQTDRLDDEHYHFPPYSTSYRGKDIHEYTMPPLNICIQGSTVHKWWTGRPAFFFSASIRHTEVSLSKTLNLMHLWGRCCVTDLQLVKKKLNFPSGIN